jgi:hypothetical protein
LSAFGAAKACCACPGSINSLPPYGILKVFERNDLKENNCLQPIYGAREEVCDNGMLKRIAVSL